jgi:hypothetical protein
MHKLHKLLRFLLPVLLLSSCLLADEARRNTVVISVSGQTGPPIENISGAVTASFEELIAGSPSTVSIVIQGCMQGGTCTTLETNTSTTAGQIRTPTISTVYDYFTVQASWTGGTKVSVTVNATLTTAVNGGGGGGPSTVCIPGSFAAQTDGATVTWAIGSSICANASLLFTVHSGSRTLALTGLVNGGSYILEIQQDSTGGEGLTLGSGCTWKVSNGGGAAVTPSTGASAVDVLAFTYDGTNCLANFATNFN